MQILAIPLVIDQIVGCGKARADSEFVHEIRLLDAGLDALKIRMILDFRLLLQSLKNVVLPEKKA
jgi:hypothetical protein